MGDWVIAAVFFLALVVEYYLTVWWERRVHGHKDAHLYPHKLARRNRGRRY